MLFPHGRLSKLHLIFLFAFLNIYLLFSSGCGSSPDSPRQPAGITPRGNFSAPLPGQLHSVSTDLLPSLSAQVSVDGGTPIKLTVDPSNNQVIGNIDNLSEGNHTFTITYTINTVVVATASATATITAGTNTPVAFTANALTYPDDDKDGWTNLSELKNGSDPINGSDQPSPKGVTSLAQNGSVTIGWDKVFNAASYNIYIASSPGVNKSNFTSLPDGQKTTGVTSVSTKISLTNGKTYYFVVTAVNTDGAEGLVSAENYGIPSFAWSTKSAMPTERSDLGVGVINGTLYAVGGTGDIFGGGRLSTLEAYFPATDTWTTKSAMPTARSSLSVGVINDTLYAVGGEDSNGGKLKTLEAYNATSNIWSPKAPMPTARSGLAVGVVNGILYAIGGRGSSGTILNTVEVYDPSNNNWIPKAPMPTPRSGLAIGVINGILYAIGGAGSDGVLNVIEAYDPLNDQWSQKVPIPTARTRFSVGVVNGILYAIGGGDNPTAGVGSPVIHVEAYDPITNTWSLRSEPRVMRSNLSLGVVNGILYAVGGLPSIGFGAFSVVEAYTPSSNTWTSKASMSQSREDLAVGVNNNFLYAVGGFHRAFDGFEVYKTVEVYDSSSNSWNPQAAMPTARIGLAIGVVNGILYAVGGFNELGNLFNFVEAYNPSSDTWSSKATMPTARSGLAVGVVNGILYAVGGGEFFNNSNPRSTLEAYDPSSNSWTPKAPMPTPRGGLAVGVINGILYAVGGTGSSGVLDVVEAYDPSSNSWSSKAGMLTGRTDLAIGVINGILYAVGGSKIGSNARAVNTVEAYEP